MGEHYGTTRTSKPCQKCGRMMYNVPIARKYCNMCKYGFPCADKEGLQYASYCKKHGLY